MPSGFRIHESPNRVLAMGDRQSVFEPKGEYADRRALLRGALRRMECPHRFLVASCGAPAGTRGDLENWLLYNVGFSYFQDASRDGLLIWRETISHTLDGVSYPHWWSYSNTPELPTLPGSRIAEIESRSVRWPSKAAGWWRLSTDSGWMWRSDCAPSASLGLSVQLSIRGSLLSVLKPMVDGLLCALHEYPGEPGDELVRRIAASTKLEIDAVRARMRPHCASLGRRPFVWPFRRDLQWSPNDDRLHWLRIERVESHETPVMRAELLAL